MKNYFETSYGKLYYELTSKDSAKNLLLIHGFMEDHEIWGDITNYLNANIITIDLLGYGKSIPNQSFNFSMKMHAQSIRELLDFLIPRDLYVLGHSMGGYITLELSKLNPNLHLGLLHSTIQPDSEERKNNRNKTINVLEREPAIFIREFHQNLFADQNKRRLSEKIEILKQKAEKIPVPYIIETVKQLRDREDNEDTWNAAKGDLIWIGGTFDLVLDIDELEKLADDGPTCLEILELSAHMGFYEEPKKLVELLNEWMQ